MDLGSTRSWFYLLVFVGVAGFFLSRSVSAVTGPNQTLAETFQLIRDNITDRLKARYKVPIKYYNMALPVFLCYEPLQIIMVNEVSQSIIVSAAVTLSWKDPNIGWDPQDVHNLTQIEMAIDLFWTPSILVPKTTLSSVIFLRMPDQVYITYNGDVTAFIPAFTNTLCDLDMTDFPFDTHRCSIVFLEGDFYNLTTQHVMNRGISTYFGTNGAWILLGSECHPIVTTSFTPAFEYIMCYVEMRRRSTFFVTNLIGPMALTSLMTLIVFWIPAEEGEKITFLVSMFMSTFVFLNYILDMIPRSMESVPRLNLLLFAIVLQVILATAATALVLRRYQQEQEQGQSHPQQQQPNRRGWKWFWLKRHRAKAQKKQSQNEASSQSDKQLSFIQRQNVIFPEATTDFNGLDKTSQTTEKNAEVCPAKWNVDLNDLFTVDNDVPSPPEYTPPESEENKDESQQQSRRLTHKELDKVFFALMLLITIGVYLCAFLT